MLAVVCCLFLCAVGPHWAGETRRFDFENDRVRKEPRGFLLINGYDRWGASWQVRPQHGAPSGRHVLVESTVSPARSVIPKAVVRDAELPDGEVRVKLRISPAAHAQPGGEVVRYRDERNYLMVSANADVSRLVVQRVERGRVRFLAGRWIGRSRTLERTELDPTQWHQLRVRFDGPIVQIFLNEVLVSRVEDAGPLTGTHAGVWSEPGSIVYFDDLELEPRLAGSAPFPPPGNRSVEHRICGMVPVRACFLR